MTPEKNVIKQRLSTEHEKQLAIQCFLIELKKTAKKIEEMDFTSEMLNQISAALKSNIFITIEYGVNKVVSFYTSDILVCDCCGKESGLLTPAQFLFFEDKIADVVGVDCMFFDKLSDEMLEGIDVYSINDLFSIEN